MKGHLDVKDLETYKKADLQALARELGVSDEGTVKQIAARCAEVEVDVPDGENTPEGQQDKPKLQPDEVAVQATQDYKDLVLKRIVKKGELLTVKKARAAVLTERKVAKIVEE